MMAYMAKALSTCAFKLRNLNWFCANVIIRILVRGGGSVGEDQRGSSLIEPRLEW